MGNHSLIDDFNLFKCLNERSKFAGVLKEAHYFINNFFILLQVSVLMLFKVAVNYYSPLNKQTLRCSLVLHDT